MARSWKEEVEGARTLVEVLGRRARSQADELAFTFLADGEEPKETFTFAELDRRARAVAAELAAHVEARGARVLLLYPSGLDFVAAFMGCLYAGAIAVPAYPPASRRHLPRLQSIARDAAPAVVCGTGPSLAKLGGTAAALPELAGAVWIATDALDDGLADGFEGGAPEPGDVAFLQYTSGSTAAPKGVIVSHGNLMANEAVIQRQTSHSEETVFIGWLPLYHDMGLIGNVLQPLYLGIPCVLMAPVAFLQRPGRWLEAISRYRGTTSGGPNFAYELCVRRVSDEERRRLDLSSWNVAFSGAEPVRAETLKRFADAFESRGFDRRALYPCYGMAETTLMVSGGERGAETVVEGLSAGALEEHRVVAAQGDEPVRRVVGCGTAGLDLDVAIADPESGRRLEDGRVGEIRVAGPSVAQGYWNLPEATARDFETPLEGEDVPYLRTGDLGFLRGGELFVTGRIKDLIIIRGKNHYPQDVEATAEKSHPDLRPGCGVAVSAEVLGEERLVVVHEVHRHAKDDPEVIADAIRQAVAEGHQVQVYDVVLIRQGTLPKTSSGKLQRRAALAEYLAGDLAAVGRSTVPALEADEVAGAELLLDRATLLQRGRRRSLLESFLRHAVARLTRSAASQVDPDRPLTSFGLDSLVAVELRNLVESRLGVAFELATLLEGASVAELATHVLLSLDGGTAASGRPALVAGRRDEHPLSFGQEALWYLHRLDPESAAYNVRGAARLGGDLDTDVLQRAVTALVQRHPALRTRFVSRGDDLVAVVGDEPAFGFEVSDAAGLDAAGLDTAELERRLAAEVRRPFDLAAGPLLRFAVFALADDEHLMTLTVHHAVADFWSLGILMRELGVFYGALVSERPSAELDPLALTYGDFARWQRELVAGPEGERMVEAWRRRLADPPLLDLPTDRPRPPVQTFDGDSCSTELGTELSARLAAWSAARGTTLFTTLMAAFQVVLGRWSGQRDLVVGTPTTLRGAAELEPLVGYFVNPVVIRGDLSGRPSFADLVDRLRGRVVSAFAEKDYPFPLLVEKLELPHDPSRSPLFQAMFVWQRDRLPEEEGLAAFSLGEEGATVHLGPLTASSVKLPGGSAQFDLSLEMANVGERLRASLEHNTALWDEATAERFLAHLATLLDGAMAHPEARIGELPLLTPGERHELVAAWNRPPVETAGETLWELFAAQAERTPEAVAVVDGDRRLTYGELEAAARRLAVRLGELGAGPEVPVGVCVERSAELLVALLGVLGAGAVYVPLDPAYPGERLAFTLDDCQAPLLVTRGGPPASLLETSAQEVDLDDLGDGDASAIEAAIELGALPQNLAYLIYTSGSTGRPKGVAITHRSAAVMVRWAAEAFAPSERAALMAATSVCFDLSVFEVFVPLCHGGRVVVAENALALPSLPAASEVTLVNTVPSAMRELVAGELPESVKVVNLAGEPLPRDLVEAIYAHRQVESVYNLYGPSEDTTYSTFTRVPQGDPSPPTIGRPIAGTQSYLVDGDGSLVPRGSNGELLLGGDGLARCYLGRPALTAERWVPDPFSGRAGERLYRTGDLARTRTDGELEFLGRLDHQVKVRGFRIELGEIETVLRREEAVHEAVVLAREDEPGDPRIVAYVAGDAIDVHELRQALAEHLPAFMVPQSFVVLGALPLLPNGKVDKLALPAPDPGEVSHDRDFVAPSTEVEQVLAKVWRDVLGISEIGIHDSFFELGGHSLQATRVLTRVREAFGVDLPVRSLLEAPTIAGLVESIAASLMSEADEETLLAILDEEESIQPE